MAFRDPIYLDIPLLKNLADYYGISVPGPSTVTMRKSGGRKLGAGVSKIVDVSVQSDKGQATEETYSTEFRPVRLVNDLIDTLLETRDLIDLVDSPDSALTAHDVVQIEGELVMSPATELGSLMARFFPMLLNKYSAGEDEPTLDQSEILQIMMAPQAEGNQVYDLDVADAAERRFVIILDPQHVAENRSGDDLEGDLTVFGSIDRLLSETGSLPLTQYLFPGMNRTMRRAIRRTSLDDLLGGFSDITGQTLDASVLSVTGPGAIIKPVAIY